MATHHTDRTARIMAAALSRRRALKGLAGGAALGLGLAARPRRGHAGIDPASLSGPGRLLDLPGAVVWPFDLPDGDRFGLAPGVSFVGAAGGVAAQVLSERMVAAIGPDVDALVGGHTAFLTPLDGSTAVRRSTELLQFDSAETAARASDGIAAGHFAGTTELPPPDPAAGGRLFTWTFQDSGGTGTILAHLGQVGPVVAMTSLVNQLDGT